MAGTVAQTNRGHRVIKRCTLAWTSTTGTVSGTTNASVHINGELRQIYVISSTGTTGPPTTAYDLILYDDHDVDILRGAGANISTTAGHADYPMLSGGPIAPITESTTGAITDNLWVVDGPLELYVTNAGNLTQGTVHVYYQGERTDAT